MNPYFTYYLLKILKVKVRSDHVIEYFLFK